MNNIKYRLNKGGNYIKKKIYYFILIFVFIIISLILINNKIAKINNKEIMQSNTSDKSNNESSKTMENDIAESDYIKVDEPIFTYQEIPENILEKMIGNSIPRESIDKVNIEELAYLNITYLGFDKESHIGEMIVNKNLAEEVIDIFKEVYMKKYPIEKIRLIDEYGADDEKSMEDNNTSAFCYRDISNTNNLSNHAKGCAIDINPLYNPYVVKTFVSPTNAAKYVDRTIAEKGIIQKGDDLYNAFIKRNWTWGGEWKNPKDYQHFEKSY